MNFSNADLVAVVAVAVMEYGHVKVELVVNAIRVCTAHVKVHAASAEHRTRATVSDRVFFAQNSNADAAFQHDDVFRKESFVVLHRIFHVVEECFYARDKRIRHVVAAAAWSKEVCREAGACDFFEDVVNHFTFLETEQEASLSAKVTAKATVEHQVRGNAAKFLEHHADVFATERNAHVHALFKSNHDAQVILDGGQIVLTVRHGDVLQVAHRFRLLFHTAVDIAKVRDNFYNGLTVHAERESQSTMSTRVLRTHVDEKFFGICFALDAESRRECCTHTGLLIICGWVKSLRSG